MKLIKLSSVIFCSALSASALAQQVFNSDVVIQGSACVGFDCPSSPSFGFDTLRLQENNLRIHFDDTSASASFPNNDWRLEANDSTNGGANRFSIADATAGRTPFTIEAGAVSNSIRVDNSGNVGLSEDNPIVELHITDGDSPTVRLEQDGSSGFTPQTWDMAGNETNFFIRNVTTGSRLPFRIRPSAKDDALVLEDDEVGIGTDAPTATLHIRNNAGDTQVLVEETNGTAAARTLLELKNPGNTKLNFNNSDAAVEWSLANSGTDFRISRQASGAVEFDLENNGNLTISGTLTENSDRNAKTNIVALDQRTVLEKVKALPIQQWQYKDALGENHIGPMAQDFHAAFGLGATNKGITTLDTSGVALVSIQALATDNDRLTAENQQLKAMYSEILTAYHRQQEQLVALEEQSGRVAILENMVKQILENQPVQPVLTQHSQ